MAATKGPRLRLYIDGTDALLSELHEMAARARNAKPVLRVIQELMARGAREQFESQGERGGQRWKPDTTPWEERKRKAGEQTGTERRTGELMESLLASKGDFAGEIRKVNKTSTTFGTTIFAAQWQGHKRRLLEITLKDADRWAELLVDWILSGNS